MYVGPGCAASAGTACSMSTESHGSTMVRFGMRRRMARSSVAWWLGPYPVVSPGSPATTLTLSAGSAMSRHRKSYARRVAKTAYVDANGTNPTSGRRAAAAGDWRLSGHAAVEEPIRVRVAEDVHVGVLGQIGGRPDDLGAFVGQPGERVAERGAGGLLTRVGERSDHRRGGELRGGLGGVHPRKPSSS